MLKRTHIRDKGIGRTIKRIIRDSLKVIKQSTMLDKPKVTKQKHYLKWPKSNKAEQSLLFPLKPIKPSSN